jgi:hypothetical protein
MTYNFDVKFQHGKFEVGVDTSANYGYFEHETKGDECGGGLWFEGKELTDFDGLFELPKAVAEGLREHGFVVSSDFD